MLETATPTSPLAPPRRALGPRIVLDAGPVVGPRTGVGQATAGLLSALGRAWPERWPAPVAWVNSPRHPLPGDDLWMAQGRFEVIHTRHSGKMLLRGWQWFNRPRLEGLVGPAALVHSPSGVVPSVRAARRIVTVHDLYFRHRPEHCDAYGGRYFEATYASRLRLADRVFCVSEFTRQELLRFYELDPARLEVVHWGVDHDRFHPRADAADAEALGTHGLEAGGYLLAVSTHEPRKNLPRLIEGFARAAGLLAERGAAVPTLAIVGGAGWGGQNLEARARRAGIAERVRFLGYQPGDRLPVLYRGALGLVFPSLYEGFGLPALEAMACGCPCALARIESLLEVAGKENAAWFDPADPEAMARLLTEFIDEPDYRARLATAGPARARRFTWAATARQTLDAYQAVLATPAR